MKNKRFIIFLILIISFLLSFLVINLVSRKHYGLIPGFLFGISITFLSLQINLLYFPNLLVQSFFVIRYLAFYSFKIIFWATQILFILVINLWFSEAHLVTPFGPFNLFTFLLGYFLIRIKSHESFKNLINKK